MKRNSGSSLLEIIISVAIIGVIVVGLLPAVGGYFVKIINTRTLTKDIFTAQQSIEDEIQYIKDNLETGSISADPESYTLFDGSYRRTVQGYPLAIGSSPDHSLQTIVADTRIPDFEVATVSSAKIALWSGAEIPYAYASTPSLSIKSTVQINDPEDVHLVNIYRWYVSRVGFNINPSETDTPGELEVGTVYPSFPDDYTIISLAKTANLTAISSSYAGRFIVCTATPASKSGKMGRTAVSNAVFISGLPVIDGLRIHLDASMVAKNDTTVAIRKVGNSLFVKKWVDISLHKLDAAQSTANRQPQLMTENMGEIIGPKNVIYETYAKFIRYGANTHRLVIPTTGLTAKKPMTLFIVLRSAGSNMGITDGQWHVFKGNNTFTSFQIDDGGTINGVPSGISFSNGTITLGNAIIDAAEMIVYDRILTNEEASAVNQYLMSKYMN